MTHSGHSFTPNHSPHVNTRTSLFLSLATLAMPTSAQPAQREHHCDTNSRPGHLLRFQGGSRPASAFPPARRKSIRCRKSAGRFRRVEGGPFSGYSAEFNGKQYFKIPYAETGDLNIGGPGAEVSMFAVVRIVNLKQSRTPLMSTRPNDRSPCPSLPHGPSGCSAAVRRDCGSRPIVPASGVRTHRSNERSRLPPGCHRRGGSTYRSINWSSRLFFIAVARSW